ncbi:hypothetical protein BDN72DRAFT_859617 [Pluteus cervinus]|uniref:Uncharacterized protein n=1 Tax=Pluteus cervinus TaxID=181527 RepID=A0ACD3ALW4_9AGAR|nr:hypothetical protein BDN72DRAFT_859617 [Pluteus cervinus]
MRSEILLESQKKLDEEIRALEKRIISLRTSRNALALINRLPMEILTEIFACVQASYNCFQMVKWLRVAHVCKNWRTISFSSRNLWSTLPTHRVKYAKVAAQLSYPHPVSITNPGRVSESRGLSEEALNIFLPLLQRARKVAASGLTGSTFAKALQNAPSDFSQLQEIEFSFVRMPLETSPFPKSLRCLNLSWTQFRWSWLKLDHLTELHLTHVPAVTVSSFWGYMSQIPRLSSLEIYHIFSTPGFEPEVLTHSPHSSSLLELRSLGIKDRLSYVTEFLAGIRFEGKFMLTAELYLKDVSLGDIVHFSQSISHLLQGSQRDIRSILLEGHEILELSASECVDSSPFLVLRADLPDPTVATWLTEIQKFPLGDLQKLSTNLIKDPLTWWVCRFGNLPNLYELVLLDDKSSRSFINYLAAETKLAKYSDNWNDTRVSFATLKKVTFQGVHHRERNIRNLTSSLKERGEETTRVQLCEMAEKVTVTVIDGAEA